MSRDPMNDVFCKILLRLALQELTGNELKHFRANAGCLKMSGGGTNTYYLVEWPKMDKGRGTFAWEVQAHNAAEAKAKALNIWLTHHAATVRAQILAEGWESRGLKVQP